MTALMAWIPASETGPVELIGQTLSEEPVRSIIG
jgi:hypothetical protein